MTCSKGHRDQDLNPQRTVRHQSLYRMRLDQCASNPCLMFFFRAVQTLSINGCVGMSGCPSLCSMISAHSRHQGRNFTAATTAMAVVAPLFGRVPLQKLHAHTATVAVVPRPAPTAVHFTVFPLRDFPVITVTPVLIHIHSFPSEWLSCLPLSVAVGVANSVSL